MLVIQYLFIMPSLSSRTNIKPRNTTPPSLARNPSSSVPTNKRKTYTESYIARYV